MLWRASLKSYLSSLSLLIIEKKSKWQTDLQIDQRIVLSSLFELFLFLFEVMVLSCSRSYHSPNFCKHPCEGVGKRGTDTEERTTFGAAAAAAAVTGWWRMLKQRARHPGSAFGPTADLPPKHLSSRCPCLLPVKSGLSRLSQLCNKQKSAEYC